MELHRTREILKLYVPGRLSISKAHFYDQLLSVYQTQQLSRIQLRTEFNNTMITKVSKCIMSDARLDNCCGSLKRRNGKGLLPHLAMLRRTKGRTPVMKSHWWGHHACQMEQMDTFNTTVSQVTGNSGPDRHLGRLQCGGWE